MALYSTLLSAFLMGLLGAAHCLGMCGGIVSTLALNTSGASQRFSLRNFSYHSAYNLGRIGSYSMAGALAGGLGGSLFALIGKQQAVATATVIGSVFMLALAAYLMGATQFLRPLENAGAKLWRHIEPLGRRLFPVDSQNKAFLLGLVWGWLPCGLSYSAVALALASGSVYSGALTMMAFGLGTLPALMLMGLSAQSLSR